MSDAESDVQDDVVISKEEFKGYVKEWIDINNKLTQLKSTLNQLNKRKKVLTPKIIRFMESHKAEFLNLGNDGSIKMKQTKVTKALNKTSISELLLKFGKSENETSNIVDFLWSEREVKYTPKLELKES